MEGRYESIIQPPMIRSSLQPPPPLHLLILMSSQSAVLLYCSGRIVYLTRCCPSSTRRFALSLWMCVDPNRQEKGWLEGRFGL